MTTEKTLVLIKPEGVQRHLVGKVLTRFEDAGLKIIGMKQVWVNKEFAKKHYTKDIAERRGEKVREMLLDYIITGPVIAICLQGVDVIKNVRKIVGGTEPSSAPPGTIRGDFAHISFAHADKNQIPVKNIIHASSDEKDASVEVPLWFKESELHDFQTIQDFFM